MRHVALRFGGLAFAVAAAILLLGPMTPGRGADPVTTAPFVFHIVPAKDGSVRLVPARRTYASMNCPPASRLTPSPSPRRSAI